MPYANQPRNLVLAGCNHGHGVAQLSPYLPCEDGPPGRGRHARALHGESLDPQLVTRVNRVVTSWVQNDPLRELEEALRGQLENGATPA